MHSCPAGHRSGTPDWCDVCGRAIGAPPPPYGAPDARCTVCGAERPGRFCDECGADAALPPATALVTTDAAWFAHVCQQVGDAVRTLAVPDIPPRRVRLEHGEITIGRRSRRNDRVPDVDLTGDPGVSARHALLVAGPHGGWSVVDLGSRNGTAVGGPSLDEPATGERGPGGPDPADRPVQEADRRAGGPEPRSADRPTGTRFDLVAARAATGGESSGSTVAAGVGRIHPHTPVPVPPGRVIRLGLWTAVRVEPGT